MIINHYLADKNTTEIFKISDTYKFDSWNKEYVLKAKLLFKNNHNGVPFEAKNIVGKFTYYINSTPTTVTVNHSFLVSYTTIIYLLTEAFNGRNDSVRTLMNEEFNGRKLGDISNNETFNLEDITLLEYYGNSQNENLTSNQITYIEEVFLTTILSDFTKYSMFINKDIFNGILLYTNINKPDKIGNSYIILEQDSETNLENFLSIFNYNYVLSINAYHNSSIESNIDYNYPSAKINNYYRVTFSVESNEDFGVYVMLGASKGEVVTQSGTYVQYIRMTDSNLISFFASGNVKIYDFKLEEYKIIADPLDLTDRDGFINKSWTLSFSFNTGKWVSFHSYLPNYYLTTNVNLYSIFNDDLSVEHSIRDEDNNYIVDSNNNILVYKI